MISNNFLKDISIFEDVWQLLSMNEFELDPETIREDLVCTICKRIMIDSCRSACGCHYCYNCITKYLKDGDKYCLGGKQQCNEEYLCLKRDVFRDMRTNNKIYSLKVYCPNESCHSKVVLNVMREHLRVCSKKSLHCPYGPIGCENREEAKDVTLEHLHKDEFEHTQLLIDWIYNLKNEIDGLKRNFEMSQLEIDTLREECRRKDVEIREMFGEIAEGNKILIKDMEDQKKEIFGQIEEKKIQIKSLKDESYNRDMEIREIIAQMAEDNKRIIKEMAEHRLEISHQMTDLKKQIKEQRAEIIEHITDQKNQIESIKEDAGNKEYKSSMLLDQVKDVVDEISSGLTNMARKTLRAEMSLEAQNQVIDIVREDQRMKIDNVQIQLSELKDVMKIKTENFSDNFTLKMHNLVKLCPTINVDFIWRIEGCTSKMNAMKGKRIFSESFYSNSYKLCLYLYINNTGNNVGLYCLIMKGDNDDSVHWPMKLPVTISIIDQDTLRVHKSVTYQYDSYIYNKSVFDRPTKDMNDHGICACPIIDCNYIKERPSIIVNDSIVASCVINN